MAQELRCQCSASQIPTGSTGQWVCVKQPCSLSSSWQGVELQSIMQQPRLWDCPSWSLSSAGFLMKSCVLFSTLNICSLFWLLLKVLRRSHSGGSKRMVHVYDTVRKKLEPGLFCVVPRTKQWLQSSGPLPFFQQC